MTNLERQTIGKPIKCGNCKGTAFRVVPTWCVEFDKEASPGEFFPVLVCVKCKDKTLTPFISFVQPDDEHVNTQTHLL